MPRRRIGLIACLGIQDEQTQECVRGALCMAACKHPADHHAPVLVRTGWPHNRGTGLGQPLGGRRMRPAAGSPEWCTGPEGGRQPVRDTPEAAGPGRTLR